MPEETGRDSLAEVARESHAEVVARQPDSRQPDSDAWYRQAEPATLDDVDEDLSDIRVVKRFARRRRAMRVLGALAVVGTLVGAGYVLEQPKVRREALSFVTMGHPDAAVRAGHRLATFVEALRHH